MKKENSPVTFGVVVGNREFFPNELSVKGGKKVIDELEKKGYETVTSFSAETGEGLVATREESKKCSKVLKENSEKIDGVIITLPNFGDEKSVSKCMKRANLDVPVMVHAFPDDKEKMDRKNRKDAFCGKFSVCNNLYQQQISFINTRKHVEEPTSQEFNDDLNHFERVCRTIDGIKGARLGLVGPRPNPFNTVRFSEKILEKNNISVENVSLLEMIEEARKMEKSNQKLQENKEMMKREYTISPDMPDDDFDKIARIYTVFSKWVEENELDTIAVQTYPSVPKHYGVSPLGAMSYLSESYIPSAPESDVTGSLAMYILQLASGKPAAIADINNNYGEEPNKFVLWHCSSFPNSFFGENECELGYHDMQEMYGACSGEIAPGPITLFRVSTDDVNGQMRVYIAEGEITDDNVDTFGSYGVVKIEELESFLKLVADNGFEHHVAAVRDYVGDVLEEAIGKYMNWEVYRHNP